MVIYKTNLGIMGIVGEEPPGEYLIGDGSIVPNPAGIEDVVTFKAKLTLDGVGLSGEQIKFYAGENLIYYVKTDSLGVATLTRLASPSWNGLTIEARWSPDEPY